MTRRLFAHRYLESFHICENSETTEALSVFRGDKGGSPAMRK